MTSDILENKYSISLVSYWNTKPFLFGMDKTGLLPELNLHLDVPSAGGKRLLEKQVDIALAPVITLQQMDDANIITDFCIGANGPVRTVCLYATVPLKEITKIYLDRHSMTSVQLLRVLLAHYWQTTPELLVSDVHIAEVGPKEAALVIGDKSFQWEGHFPYVYDLAENWTLFTGKPFVFAAWISRKEIAAEWIERMNTAFEYGLQHIDDVMDTIRLQHISRQELQEYFTKHIDYRLDAEKHQAIHLYLDMVTALPT